LWNGRSGTGADRGAVERVGDFTTDRRVLTLTAIAVVIGVIGVVLAYALLWLIAVITNLAFHGRWSSRLGTPAGAHLGLGLVAVPVLGGLVVGFMARYGSEKIRGHGIPEAMEAILLGGSRIEPKVALLKPLSSAIAIGTGGPFGAEGPIIMTGGAVGSLVGQLFHLSSAERKTLLVAGAAAGMSATFGTPVAAVLLAVELLLFEWKPRSFVPVAVASGVAAGLRPVLFDAGALFPASRHPSLPGAGLLASVAVGVVAGFASCLVTALVYGAEDAFRKLPVHWMWWPALGGIVIGAGGLVEPRALGVGYENVRAMLAGHSVGTALVTLLIVKAVIWSVSLGSGTSGGVLAPLLIMGGALGVMESHVIPTGTPAVWALVSMAAMLSGTMGAPLTAVVFSFELTRDAEALLPLLLACTAAFTVAVLLMRRSILTEKVARRGHHLSRETSVDPFELLRVGEIMTVEVECLPATMAVAEAVAHVRDTSARPDPTRRHQGYPVVDEAGVVVGMVTRGDALAWELDSGAASGGAADATLAAVISAPAVTGRPDEPVGRLADRMAAAGVGRAPVVGPDGCLVGIVSRRDLLRARSRYLTGEVERQRLLVPRSPRGPRALDDGLFARSGIRGVLEAAWRHGGRDRKERAHGDDRL
jgi:chloride channel protein, CIC family